jgi:hypothetical protein
MKTFRTWIGPMRGSVRLSSTSVLLSLLVVQGLLLPTEAMTQERIPDPPRVVVVPGKSPFLAGALEIITLPTIGYAYAGNWTRGFPSAAVRILGFALWREQLYWSPPPCQAQCIAGAIMLYGGWIWAASDAAGTARRTNEERRTEALRGAVLPTLHRGSLGVQIQLRVSR